MRGGAWGVRDMAATWGLLVCVLKHGFQGRWDAPRSG